MSCIIGILRILMRRWQMQQATQKQSINHRINQLNIQINQTIGCTGAWGVGTPRDWVGMVVIVDVVEVVDVDVDVSIADSSPTALLLLANVNDVCLTYYYSKLNTIVKKTKTKTILV